MLGVSLLASALICPAAHAQDAPSGGDAPKANPLSGLFTPQPQFPTPQSHDNPTPAVAGANPLGALFNVQPQYPNAQSPGYATPQTPNGANPLAGFMTGQPRSITPQTLLNPDPKPRLEGPYGTEKKPEEAAKPAETKATEEAAKDKDDKDEKEKKEKEEKEAKEKEAKEKEAKEKEAREKEAKEMAYNPVREAIYQLNSGNYGEALQTLSRVLKQQPGNAQAYYVRGVVNVALRNYPAAIDDYNHVIRLAPVTPLSALAANGLRKIGAPPPATPKLPPLKTTR